MFEVHSNTGAEVKGLFWIEIIFYDKEGKIAYTTRKLVKEEDFYGFQVMKFEYFKKNAAHNIGKIGLYPTKYI